ncbi:RrF2 family transcriptional regulator [Longirhabdus pacifica]|uniref:RrF2 family transcriptional regulator n=1 Tax=Longirhabdus pacifica TaxID=2305227 RepID=UPI00100898EF|nr:Rrf2 family transcriptional regulator [Longirhabdus pacifica]
MSAEKTSNTKWFAYAIEALLVLANKNEICPSAHVAVKIESQSTYVRKILSYLVKAQLVGAKEGRDGGYYLKKPAHEITLADVYTAMQFPDPLPKVIFGVNDQTGCISSETKSVMTEISNEMEEWLMVKLQHKTIADLLPVNKVN